MLSQAEARQLVENAINETDWNWPTKPVQVVYPELTVARGWGWVFYHAADPEFLVHGRDPKPLDNIPYLVNKHTGEYLQANADTATW